MSVDILHEKIRKLKNPSMIDFGVQKDAIPAHILDEEPHYLLAYSRFCSELMQGLIDLVPAVRFNFDTFALMGAEGISSLTHLLRLAKEWGYYVLLDGPGILSPWGADRAAEAIFNGDMFPCDGLLIEPYIGSDAVKPFLPYCKENEKDLFVVVRSPNKSALELQDLYTGSRLVHSAAAEMVNRLGETLYGKCGYSRLGATVSAGSPTSVRTLRGGYNRMFLIVDGLDYPSGNFKNASLAFDRFGFGAVVCAGPSVTAAWKETDSDGTDYVSCAVKAAENMKKNILRYVTIL